MPAVPIDMPSETPMVLNRMPISPAWSTPSLTFAASSLRCMLQVLPSYHMEAIPTCALSRSSGVSPVPYSIACDAPCTACCVIRRENLLRSVISAWYSVFGSQESAFSCPTSDY